MKNLKLSDGSYSVSGIQNYFKYILQKTETVTDNASIMIYLNEIENKNTSKIKTEYYLELLLPETMKSLRSTKSNITKDENGENAPHSDITKVVLVHCNIVNTNYQHDSRVLYTFVLNKSFGQLLDVSLKNFIFLKTFNSEFSYIEVWFTDQNSKPLVIEDKINITLVIN